MAQSLGWQQVAAFYGIPKVKCKRNGNEWVGGDGGHEPPPCATCQEIKGFAERETYKYSSSGKVKGEGSEQPN